MVVHETIGMANPVVPFIHAIKSIEKGVSVLLVSENGLLFVPPGCDVIDCTRVFYAQRTSHKMKVASSSLNVNKIDLTPYYDPLLEMRNRGGDQYYDPLLEMRNRGGDQWGMF